MVKWEFLENSEIGGLTSDYSGRFVNSLVFGLGEKQRLSLNEVVDAFGPPKSLYIDYVGHDHCTTAIVFPTIRMSVSIEKKCVLSRDAYDRESVRVNILDDTLIYGIGLNSEESDLEPKNLRTLMNWNGYGEYTRELH
jgi:hypothetical protein